jgi:hypothetical protein
VVTLVRKMYAGIVIILIMTLSGFTDAFRPVSSLRRSPGTLMMMAEVTKGVEFDTVAREWRMKWSPDNDKASLASAQQTLDVFAAQLKSIPGVKSVQRIVCGGCMDFKVITALDAEAYGAWEQRQFAPEAEFFSAIKAVPGLSQLEQQTYTIMPV